MKLLLNLYLVIFQFLIVACVAESTKSVGALRCSVKDHMFVFNVSVPEKYENRKNETLRLLATEIDEGSGEPKELVNCVQNKTAISCQTHWNAQYDYVKVAFTLQMILNSSSNTYEYKNITKFYNILEQEVQTEWSLVDSYYCYEDHGIQSYYANSSEDKIHLQWTLYEHDLWLHMLFRIQLNSNQIIELDKNYCNGKHCDYELQGLEPCKEYTACITSEYWIATFPTLCKQFHTQCDGGKIETKEIMIIFLGVIITVLLGILSTYCCYKNRWLKKLAAFRSTPRLEISLPVLTNISSTEPANGVQDPDDSASLDDDDDDSEVGIYITL